MNDTDRKRFADALTEAYRTREPIDPITDSVPEMTVEDAYAIQLLQIEDRVKAGRQVRGHKVGLTAAVMQRMLGVDQPDFGHLLDDMFWPEDAKIPVDAFVQPRVEPEIAIVLKKELRGPGVTAADALDAVDFVLPSIEIIDSRIRDWKIKFCDTVADNASSGGLVLGSDASSPHDIDVRLAGCNLYINGEVVATGAGGAALGHPMLALAWCANTLGERGVALEAGEVIMPGSCTSAIRVNPGDVVTAHFAGVGSVTAVFAQEDQPS